VKKTRRSALAAKINTVLGESSCICTGACGFGLLDVLATDLGPGDPPQDRAFADGCGSPPTTAASVCGLTRTSTTRAAGFNGTADPGNRGGVFRGRWGALLRGVHMSTQREVGLELVAGILEAAAERMPSSRSARCAR
jgi:hypothetical protein